MLSYEELEQIVNSIKDGLDETTSALVSEDLLKIISNYKLGIDEIERLNEEVKKLTEDKDELLRVNGRLFQKLGFENEEEEKEIMPENVEDEEKIDIEDIIDEKGELI